MKFQIGDYVIVDDIYFTDRFAVDYFRQHDKYSAFYQYKRFPAFEDILRIVEIDEIGGRYIAEDVSKKVYVIYEEGLKKYERDVDWW